MKNQLIIQDNINGKIYDISDFVVGKITHETTMDAQAGKLSFSLQSTNDLPVFNEGSVVSFKNNDNGVFFGFLFKVEEQESKISFTAYDQMRYLKNKDSMVISGHTASTLFGSICKDKKIKYSIINASSYRIPDKIMDGNTYFEIIDYGISQTLINDGKWFYIYDDFGVVKFVNLNSLRTNFIAGPHNIIKSHTFTSSIDEDTYNQIKLLKENKETLKREIYIVKDSNTINQWGLLQYYETVDEDANEAQIKERADMLLALKNRKTRAVKLPCIGDNSVRAGSGIIINIPSLERYNIINNRYHLVKSCTHSYENDYHSMNIEVELSI